MANTDQRISGISLDEHSVVRRSPQVEHEQKAAIYDLIEDNEFSPIQKLKGPFNLILKIEENRLVFNVLSERDESLTTFSLSLNAFRSLIREYFMVCESYYDAIKSSSPSQIEAIDVGRRSLHNEGAALLKKRLREKVVINDRTARRLFTLLCVLHIRG
ncbi:MAG: UPF0262 family protein [Rhodospirillales bacterium]|jgi:uncharacterized protein (UPF0262 family)